MARPQKVDGLMDITARDEAGSFYTPGRTTLIPAGQAAPRTSPTGTTRRSTTFGSSIDYAVAKAWTVGAGYAYEKYRLRGRVHERTTSSTPTQLTPRTSGQPSSDEADNGAYKANVGYATLTYRF